MNWLEGIAASNIILGASTLSNKNMLFAHPKSDPTNSFASLFSTSLVHRGFDVREFTWGPRIWPGTILLHWPDEFFGANSVKGYIKAALKLAVLLVSKSLRRTKIIWVCHNVKPHDKCAKDTLVQRLFLKSIDGLVFLSDFSRGVVLEAYPVLADTPFVATVHGRYNEAMGTPVPCKNPAGAQKRLLAFGQVRRYKNFDKLAKIVSLMNADDVILRISGRARDHLLVEDIERSAAGSPSVMLDIRESNLPYEEIERAIDDADGVVLPYTAILNSGSALLSLSRNTRVLAPRIGSLPELQSDVGEDWLTLYDGAISRDAIERFAGSLSSRPTSPECNLEAYSWDRVGQDVSRLIHAVHKD